MYDQAGSAQSVEQWTCTPEVPAPGHTKWHLQFDVFGIFWNFLELFGIFWNFLEFFGIFWNFLEFFGIFWNFLEFFGIFWNLLEFI